MTKNIPEDDQLFTGLEKIVYNDYEQNDLLRDAVDALEYGFAGESFSNIKSYLLDPSYSIADPYMCLKDFDDTVLLDFEGYKLKAMSGYDNVLVKAIVPKNRSLISINDIDDPGAK